MSGSLGLVPPADLRQHRASLGEATGRTPAASAGDCDSESQHTASLRAVLYQSQRATGLATIVAPPFDSPENRGAQRLNDLPKGLSGEWAVRSLSEPKPGRPSPALHPETGPFSRGTGPQRPLRPQRSVEAKGDRRRAGNLPLLAHPSPGLACVPSRPQLSWKASHPPGGVPAPCPPCALLARLRSLVTICLAEGSLGPRPGAQ